MECALAMRFISNKHPSARWRSCEVAIIVTRFADCLVLVVVQGHGHDVGAGIDESYLPGYSACEV